MKNLEIKIVGTRGTGKSTVSQIIENALLEAGFNSVSVLSTDLDLDIPFSDIDKRVESLNKTNLNINITQVQAKRGL